MRLDLDRPAAHTWGVVIRIRYVQDPAVWPILVTTTRPAAVLTRTPGSPRSTQDSGCRASFVRGVDYECSTHGGNGLLLPEHGRRNGKRTNR